ncbi:MAG: nickel-responsive transcriptional regulator NikR, partial [Candidatus Bathyarchaeota archaeon]
ITIIYEHEVKGLQEALTDIQHKYEEIINSSMHIHIDKENCLEIIAVTGKIKAIKNLTQELIKQRGVKQLKLSTVTF